jgi:hypothetical protein
MIELKTFDTPDAALLLSFANSQRPLNFNCRADGLRR